MTASPFSSDLNLHAVALTPELNKTIVVPTAKEDPVEEKRFYPMLHGKGTDAVAGMAGVPPEESVWEDTGMIRNQGVELIIHQFHSFCGGKLGVSTHKLLCKAIIAFTKQNKTAEKSRELRSLRVSIPLEEYALECGYDVLAHPTSTPEAAKAEAKRVKNVLSAVRKKLKRDVQLLMSSSLHWEETVKGAPRDFAVANLLGSASLRRGMIQIEFTLTFSEYLVLLPLTQYPSALFRVDERNKNAYVLGLKLVEHYNLDNNQIRKTANLLRVKSLLQVLDLPDIATLQQARHGWMERIKEPLEIALEKLVACGVLADWRYSLPKGEEMTDQEAAFSRYADWEDALIYFTLKDAPAPSARVQQRQEALQHPQKKKSPAGKA